MIKQILQDLILVILISSLVFLMFAGVLSHVKENQSSEKIKESKKEFEGIEETSNKPAIHILCEVHDVCLKEKYNF